MSFSGILNHDRYRFKTATNFGEKNYRNVFYINDLMQNLELRKRNFEHHPQSQYFKRLTIRIRSSSQIEIFPSRASQPMPSMM